MAYKRLTDKKPAAMAAVRVNITAGATEAEIKAEGVTDAFKFIKHQLFLAGLKDGIRDKVLEMEKPTFTESVKAARNLETIWEDLPDEQLGQLAVLRFQQKRITNNQASSTTTIRNPNMACRYCQKKGHLQKDCFACKRNKAPMVDTNGKPYQNQNGNRVNHVADQNTAAAATSTAAAHPASEAGYEDAFIGSVANLSRYHHLNW